MPRYQVPKEVEEIYEAYPRKVGKPAAIRAILNAVRRHGYGHVIEKTKLYAARLIEVGKSLEFVPHPSTYFNSEMYNDDLEALLPKANGHKKSTVQLSDLRTVLKAKQDLRAALRARYRNEGPLGYSWSDEQKRQEAQKLSNEIKKITTEIASQPLT